MTGRAKVVLTSRTQHFRSTEQVRTALGERVGALTASRVVVLEDFSEEQILAFLTNLYDGDDVPVRGARFELLGGIEEPARPGPQPADARVRRRALDGGPAARRRRSEQGRISAAELYREIIDFWLAGEAERQQHRHGLPSLDEQERLAACTALALRLWASKAPRSRWPTCPPRSRPR